MTVPHQFPSLLQGLGQVVLIAGTGLSAPHAPTVRELKSKLDEVADDLGVGANDNFYVLAESVLKKLDQEGKSDSESRLWLAERLGLLDDRRWFGEFGLPLSGNTPRHRALARFVIDGELRAIISLNWDALLEAALDSVGMKNRESQPRPWRVTEYARVIDSSHAPLLARAGIFPVFKPHGCVRELVRRRNQFRSGDILGKITFKLTESEMKGLGSDPIVVDTQVKASISACPLIGIGWSATEDYLRTAIIDIAKETQREEPDPFTLIDLKWSLNHTDIADAYGKRKEDSFAQVNRTSPVTSDDLMQWLQARYAITRMLLMIPPSSGQRTILEQILKELAQPANDNPIQNWVDFWLPAWVRLCWRSGAMLGVNPVTNAVIEPSDIPVSPRDAIVDGSPKPRIVGE